MTLLSDQLRLAPAELEAYWMPFTANRQFKSKPRMMAKAEGMYYTTVEGQRILDGFSGLWCTNAGHCRAPIVEAQLLNYTTTNGYKPEYAWISSDADRQLLNLSRYETNIDRDLNRCIRLLNEAKADENKTNPNPSAQESNINNQESSPPSPTAHDSRLTAHD